MTLIGLAFLDGCPFPFHGNEVLNFYLFHFFDILEYLLRDGGFGDPDGKDLDTRGPFLEVLAEGFHECLIEAVEEIDVDFL